uniref:Uncharacterized protein n=1 Tax=Moniliophthora roreri TaxID=221103 RepID=A0A0W0F768_MONRR
MTEWTQVKFESQAEGLGL